MSKESDGLVEPISAPVAPAPAVPESLESALRHHVAQYSPVRIKKCRDIEIHEDFLVLHPTPSADETWAAGGMLKAASAADEILLEPSEIVEFDPDIGRIYVDIADALKRHGLTEMLRRAGHEDARFEYLPLNFGQALQNAYERLRLHPAALSRALELACGKTVQAEGTVPPPSNETNALPVGENDSGESMVKELWDLPWGILWGPPGTGKTQAIADHVVSRMKSGRIERVLITAPTNISADEIAARLCRGLKSCGRLFQDGLCRVYRGGRAAGSRLSKEFPECLRDEGYAEHYDALKQQIHDLEQRRQEAAGRGKAAEAAKLNKELRRLRSQLCDQTDFVLEHGRREVMVLTAFRSCSYAGLGEPKKLFGKIIVDEAGMVSRAAVAALSTIARTGLLVGDPKQIGPIASAPEGLMTDVREWLALSGLGHLRSPRETRSDRHVRFLSRQHRMHPDICRAVSGFTYDGMLSDAADVTEGAAAQPSIQGLPRQRAAYVLLDEIASSPAEAHHRRARAGRGYERKLSAQVAAALAGEALKAKHAVLMLAPYRAQIRAMKEAARDAGALSPWLSIGTIHRHQGAEREVVILDLVNGACRWNDAEISMLLNVAMSRAVHHFILVISRAELESNPLLKKLQPLLVEAKVTRKDLRLETAPDLWGGAGMVCDASACPAAGALDESVPAKDLGEEIVRFRRRLPLYSAEQIRLIEQNLREGHCLVRGVAGSGKSLVLAHWAVRFLKDNPAASVLVTYFNKGLGNLLKSMLAMAAGKWGLAQADLDRIAVSHVDQLSHRGRAGPFDAVFIDEAQDIEGGKLRWLYDRCKERTSSGRKLRPFVLFSDDAQNIYGRKTIEELKAQLPEGLDFRGRTIVLRESFRSTQQILSLAVNLALDPKQLYGGPSGLLDYMRVAELASEGLLIKPEDSSNGLYRVRYTDRVGVEPAAIVASDGAHVLSGVCELVRSLTDEEGVRRGEILIVCVNKPFLIADALGRAGIPAVAYGGTKGTDSQLMGPRGGDAVRCCTIFSCKGHESPVSIFVNPQDLDDLGCWMKDAPADGLPRMRRCMLYVAASRAMVRQYLIGPRSAYMDAALRYSGANG